MPATLGKIIQRRLRAVADPTRAERMRAYMKSAMPYLGVSSEPMRRVCREVFAGLTWPGSCEWETAVLSIWRGAEYREERYAAIELTGVSSARAFQHMAALEMYEELVVTGEWWDYVDPIATQRLWLALKADGEMMKEAMRAWANDMNMWKRRAAILCQINAKCDTDLRLLYDCIEPSLGSKEFFLRKGIGWALRQYAWTDAAEVRRYVADNANRLSGLSRREALKNIGGH